MPMAQQKVTDGPKKDTLTDQREELSLDSHLANGNS